MKITKLLLVTFLCLGVLSAQNKDEEYIARFAKIAVQEMEIYKIPASITLAQGLLETAYGQSELAQNANNHFGIKCKKEWQGETYRYTDDAYMECFRKYNSAEESYRDHSKFLAERPYYKALFKLNPKDYKAWAYGLKKAGYATNPKYAPLLISRIEKYNLNEFDHLSMDEVDAKLAQLYPSLNLIEEEEEVVLVAKVEPEEEKKPIMPSEEEIAEEKAKKEKEKILSPPEQRIHPLDRIERHKNRNLKYIVINKGETLNQISRLYNIPVDKLKQYNDISNINLIKVEDYIFLQRKKGKGNDKYYTVKEGDDLVLISQKEGIKLKSLRKRNRLKKGDTVKVGDKLYLQGKKKK